MEFEWDAAKEPQNGANSKKYMKQPRLSDLKVDLVGSRSVRYQMRRTKKVKITINVDADTLSVIRELAEKGDMPYQRLMNHMLRETAADKQDESTRLDRLEKELAKIKKKLAA